MRLSFLRSSGFFGRGGRLDLRIAARVDQIGSQDGNGDFHGVGSLAVPANFAD